jgi:YidC/Oxa1 family membrane protein insertase
MLVTANIFQPLISVFAAVIKFYHGTVGASWGWSIVLLTVSVRLVMVPLAIKQFHGMRAMQQHQPEMKAIQRKYKDDKQRQQEEMMKFYRENGINPFASCLPLVAQFPVFISLYYMLRKNLRSDICPTIQKKFQAAYAKADVLKNHVSPAVAHKASLGQTTDCGVHYHGASFLFIHDITNTASGVTLIVLIILYAGTTMMSSWLNMAATPTMDKSTQRMMMILPLFFVVFIIRFPAGLMLYWITTNLWTMIQQYTIRRAMGPAPVSTTVIEDDEEDGGGGLGALFRNARGPRNGGDSGAAAVSKPASRTPATPPPSPRKKKKRSGRRR